MFWKVAVILVLLHGPDGREINVSIDEITSFQCKMPGVENKLFADDINTVINLTDGKYVSVTETCLVVKESIDKAQEAKQ